MGTASSSLAWRLRSSDQVRAIHALPHAWHALTRGTARAPAVLEGYNSTLLAMGQSGTGKSYTVHEPARLLTAAEGLAPRMLRMLLERAEGARAGGAFSYDVSMQALHVRGEAVYDLLADHGKMVRW